MFSDVDGTYHKGPADYSTERNLWQKAIIQTAKTQKYSVGVTGGTEKTIYSLRYNHVDQEGILKSSGYKRDGLNINLTQNLNDWLTFGTNVNAALMKYDLLNTNNTQSQSNLGIIRSAIFGRPVDAERPKSWLDEGGFWAMSSPIAYLESPDYTNQTSLFGNIFTEISFFPFLKLRSNLGYQLSNSQRHKYYPSTLWEGRSSDEGMGFALAGYNRNNNMSFENTLTFDKMIAKHHVILMGTLSMSKDEWNNYSMSRRGFGIDVTKGYDMADATGAPSISSSRGEHKLMSYLGRVDYNYDNRYYFTSNIRRDGASNFAANNKWATFYSFAVAYNIANEQFMKSLGWLDMLKVRYSIGYTGNQGIGAYASLAQYDGANYPFQDVIFNGYKINPTHPGNSDLKWETTEQNNVGVDISIYKSRINFTADYYYKHTYDLLQFKQVAMSTGIQKIPSNVGEVENRGLELSLSGVPISTKDFSWTISANWSYNKNKVLKFGTSSDVHESYGPDGLAGLWLQEGYPMGQLVGFVEDGFWNSVEEYKASDIYKRIADRKPSELPSDKVIAQEYLGEIKYKDLNNDSIIDEGDRTTVGDVNPDFVYGFTNTFKYKKLSLSVFFQGVAGNDILNGMIIGEGNITSWNNNVPPGLLNQSWTPERALSDPGSIKYPKIGSNSRRNMRFSRRYVESGAFLKLKSVTLTYQLDKPFKLKYIQKVILTVTGVNLLTFTNYSGFDPEINSAGSGNAAWRGIDVGGYPSSRTVTFGINVIF
jgi:TonB-linked SusC/RagA family outer membrane protein